jgi:coproporphyrinogen III oxidase-like Fe-S oxidoreductase
MTQTIQTTPSSRTREIPSTYPAAEWFVEAFGAAAVRAWIDSPRAPLWWHPVALNVSLPAPRDAGCACERALCVDGSACLARLEDEMAIYRAARGERAKVFEMQWSAGVTARPRAALERLRDTVGQHFQGDAELSFVAVVDPAQGQHAPLDALREVGVTTLRVVSGGDCGSAAALIEAARPLGFRAVEASVCGEPWHAGRRPIERLIAAGPSRVVLPSARMRHAARRLVSAGYVCVARNVFAMPGDSHAVAHRQGRLTCQPYGFSAQPAGAVLALGQQAIGRLGPLYYQNHRLARDYFAALDGGMLPVERGLLLTHDDIVRNAVIAGLSADLFVDIPMIEAAYAIDFRRYFDAEWKALLGLARAGVVSIDATHLALTPAGRLVCDDVCAVFDRRARTVMEWMPRGGVL